MHALKNFLSGPSHSLEYIFASLLIGQLYIHFLRYWLVAVDLQWHKNWVARFWTLSSLAFDDPRRLLHCLRGLEMAGKYDNFWTDSLDH